MLDSNWTEIQFFHSGDDFFTDMASHFRRARTRIQIETYIFDHDRLTRLLLEELRQAKTRGCEVQILVDGFGSFSWQDSLEDWCRRHQIEFRVFRPLPRGFWSLRRVFLSARFHFFRWLRGMNRRNHRKVVLIDEEVAYLGSFNWTQVHCASIMGSKAWRDSGVRLRGPALVELKESFRRVWKKSKREGWRGLLRKRLRLSRARPTQMPLRLNDSWSRRRRQAQELLHLFTQARKRILIETAYFLPTRVAIRSLCQAAQRGVQVELILPGPSDVPLVKWAAFGVLKHLISSGVKVYEYQPSILHAKFLIIDDHARLGSFNFNHRSLFHDLEVEALFDDQASVENLAQQWRQDRRLSREFSPESLAQWNWFHRLFAGLAFRLRYWL